MTRALGGADLRTSWLLSACRIHAVDQAMSHRDQFVAALNKANIAADQARVSRWESGAQKVPDRVVAAYETVLNLPLDHLSATLSGVRRALDPTYELAELPGSSSPYQHHADLDQLFARVDSSDAQGSDWLALARYLAGHPSVYLLEKSWEQLTDSLLWQLGRSADIAYIRRFEALRLLVRHPGGQRHVVRTIGAYVTQPGAHLVIHPFTLLGEVRNPKANELALRTLSTDTGRLQHGAAWVTAVKLTRGHFDPEDYPRIERIIAGLIAGAGRHLADTDVLDVVAQLPEDSRSRILAGMAGNPVLPRLEVILRTGETLPTEITKLVATQLATATQDLTPPPYRIEPDQMLLRLIREALFHAHHERRHQAGNLLTVSPYRAGLAAALVPVIERSDEPVANQAIALLQYVVTEEQRADLVRWAGDGRRPTVRRTALMALGRLPGRLSPADEAVVLGGLRENHPTQRASLYALAMGGADVLSDLTEADDEPLRRAAEWWTRSGPAIHEPNSAGH